MRHQVVDLASASERARMLASRVAARIRDRRVASYFRRRAEDQMLSDPRNLRPAQAEDIKGAEAWARRRFNAGETLYVFAPAPASMAQLKRVAIQLADTCAEVNDLEAQTRVPLSPSQAKVLTSAQSFIAKIDKPNFTALDAKFAEARKSRIALEEAHVPSVPKERPIYGGAGREWLRIRAVAEMWDVGVEFRNCMARKSRQQASLAHQLRSGDLCFYVLRDRLGAGLMVATANPHLKQIVAALGPRNAPVDDDDLSLKLLCAARNWRPPAPIGLIR